MKYINHKQILPISKFILYILILINSAVVLGKQNSSVEMIKKLINNKDFIGARIMIKKQFNEEFDFGIWREIRSLIYREPRIGYDLIFAFDNHPSKNSFLDKSENEINTLANQADQYMIEKNYNSAIDKYFLAAQKVKSFYKNNIPAENEQFYFYILHQLARAYYSVKNFKSALTIYSNLPKNYYQARQVQFEKMWTAFNINRIDQAIGSIISQRSQYFSHYLEPEAYIVQLYVFRKLCRYSESTATLKEIKFIENLISKNKFSLKEWVKMDLENLSIFALLTESNSSDTGLISESLRKSEITLIKNTLNTKFTNDTERLKKGYSKILNFSILSKSVTAKTLGKINNLPNPKVLYATGFEYWPKEDSEDWLDEFGTYYYIGESNCKSKQ